jgi:glycine cleavage system aminomethyltransferase T
VVAFTGVFVVTALGAGGFEIYVPNQHAIAVWNAIFEASTVALPTTTAATTAQLNIGFIYSTPRTKWVCVAVS